jgi:glyoxylase-like metal-dependent hydrolase (beta-lactamase superfamily II)
MTYKVYQLKVGSPYLYNFNYLIVDSSSKRAALVDPAWNQDLLLQTIQQLNVKLEAILLTHSHSDHVNLTSALVQRFHCQVYMSGQEITYYHFQSDNLCPVQDFEQITLGTTSITCLLTPGHTAGSTCFLASNSLFTGDTVFIEGCGICNMPGGSADHMFESIQKIKRVVNPFVQIYPGHSYGKPPGYPLSFLLENNLYFQFEKREHFVHFRMRENQKGILNFSDMRDKAQSLGPDHFHS